MPLISLTATGDLMPDAATLAAELQAAETTRIPMRQLSSRFPQMTLADSYRISRDWVALKQAQGQRVIGHKIGLTSRAMQRATGIDTPDYGTLMDAMVFQPNGAVPFDRFIEPRVEVELAFVLKSDLIGAGVTVFDVLNATDHIVPAVEIIDARIERLDRETGRARSVIDTIADNAANAGILWGGQPMRPDAAGDLRWIGAVLSRNGMVEETGLAAGVLGHPAQGIAWLAHRLAPWDEGLRAGQIVLAGSFVRPVEVRKGDVFHADFGPLGGFGFQFT